MDRDIVVRLHASFEDMVRREGASGTEFWCARDLQLLLGYSQWRNFEAVVNKAITACQNAGHDPRDHFAHISKMVDLGSGARRQIDDIALTRYACYLTGTTETTTAGGRSADFADYADGHWQRLGATGHR
jgi:DNA-damage-inducible protein D